MSLIPSLPDFILSILSISPFGFVVFILDSAFDIQLGWFEKMIGTSTHIRNSQRVLYPSMSICPQSWRDPIFNYDLLEDHRILGVPLTETKGFKITSPIHKIAKEIDYFRRVNNTRYQKAMIHL